MEELLQNLEQIIDRAKNCESKWEDEVEQIQLKLKAILLGGQAPIAQTIATAVAASPQQMKKRAKRLSAVVDDDGESDVSPKRSSKGNGSETITVITENVPPKEGEILALLQPKAEPEHVFARPMRAAKLKTENCLKEPSINSKLRRPETPNESIKNKKKLNKPNKSQSEPPTSGNESVASVKKVDESLVVVSDKEIPVVEIMSEEDDAASSSTVVAKKKSKKEHPTGKKLSVKVKKEKLSIESSGAPEVDALPAKLEATSSVEETLQTTNSTANATTTRGKRNRKKKEFTHRPMKEERLSTEQDDQSISSRTRGNTSKSRPDSVYEDAVGDMPQECLAEENNEAIEATPQSLPPSDQNPLPKAGDICNETLATNNVTMVTACDATFVTNQANNTFAVPPPQTTFVMENNPNATVTLSSDAVKKVSGSPGDATFDVRDPPMNDSIMTEDDSFDKPLMPPKQLPPPVKGKVLKSKAKHNELFNPCLQSPVKKKVEAFEQHAQTAAQETRLKTRSKKAKENFEPELPSITAIKASAVTTPVVGKPHAPVLGRFLTPTQQSNVTPTATNAKKLPNSASKIMAFPTGKQYSASSIKCGSSSSSQSLSRENSGEDLKKGFNKLQQLAEERKRKRELMHQQAALIREAKEKERAERLKKIMKEREEKNRKKALEMEQKKRELEEINRNLKLQEERELKQTAASKTKLDAAEAARQERDLLEQMKMPKMKMPPPPKQHNKYNFNMLHSDDSTDEEGKTSYKRPTPPQWSKSSVRAELISSQAYLPSDIIDSFFSVQPMTPDLKAIFPNIDPRYLKRNSSAIWHTPPRYSEIPKY